jgi:8-oxo-dGTP pyrophosphatase MutT (NUDIX family)
MINLKPDVVQILLIRYDGALILQHRDDKPGIANPGMITAFGGSMEPNETPEQAAFREIIEETNLRPNLEDLKFINKYQKHKATHGEDRNLYLYALKNIDDKNLQIYEGQGYVIVKQIEDLRHYRPSIFATEVMDYYFSGKLLPV